jgi:hypothetical protein
MAAPSRKEIETKLLDDDIGVAASPSRRGVAMWISTGLAIEEAQLALLLEIRTLGRSKPTSIQALELARKRDRLQGQIDRFVRSASTHLGEAFECGSDREEADVDLDDFDDSEDDSEGSNNDIVSISATTSQPEVQMIPLPSSLGLAECTELGAEDLIPLEIELRIGQANDSLENLRVHLSHKAILFRTVVRRAKSQRTSTRAWSQVTSIGKAIKLNACIYKSTRKKMISLGIEADVIAKYKPLTQEHLKVSAAITEPNARGQRNDMLTWFWSTSSTETSEGSDWMNECGCPFIYPICRSVYWNSTSLSSALASRQGSEGSMVGGDRVGRK